MTVKSRQFNHVRHILLAEFDIDRGSSLAHQYPEPTGADENFLAEQMLPDGAHLREEDWTLFFLNCRRPTEHADGSETSPAEGAAKASGNSASEQKPLLYVLNLVRTKHDSQARRGALVKAMAICVSFPAVDIFKAVLLLAMEKYYQSPSVEVLAVLFRTVNSLDLSRMPAFTSPEKSILRSWDIPDLFEEKFIAAAERGMQSRDLSDDSGDVKRSTYIDLAAPVHTSKPAAELPSPLAGARKDRKYFEASLCYDGINIPIRVPLTNYAEEVGDFSLIKLASTFSQGMTPASLSASSSTAYFSPPFHPHLMTSGAYTPPIIVLLNALLTQKRIIFLGHERPAGEVANHVLAACALGSGGGAVLRGFTERAFPYANLAHLDDLLSCPGYIAGVTNPAFKDHAEWWDVLCDVKTGRIIVSSKIAPARKAKSGGKDGERSNIEEGSSRSAMRDPYDVEFMQEVLLAIQAHYSEIAIRTKFHDYVRRFVQLAARYETAVYGQTDIGFSEKNTPDSTDLLGHGMFFADETTQRREIRLNKWRIEGWRRSISYRYYKEDFGKFLRTRTVHTLDVQRQFAKLRSSRPLPTDEIEAILDAMIRSTTNDDQIIEQASLSWFAFIL
ncbi:stabilization of polarity axis-domain-containing protein [Thamnocephalis sphaerospora]|uniref:Stabilization of polarity axis-domain-containing protein n=1 Tax=Thamnocephalis sphaerospora TaxID=78915 RepID=A0A4V1IXG8_9FUNG|nr:stabilization of polarity axis-domain-containing protein [Thamnocephalis sphaerospora]|eukprot:RKP11009.1 stabilization of polarity axis-domain-containing protein [Thamnocephalis sphaerospora]